MVIMVEQDFLRKRNQIEKERCHDRQITRQIKTGVGGTTETAEKKLGLKRKILKYN